MRFLPGSVHWHGLSKDNRGFRSVSKCCQFLLRVSASSCCMHSRCRISSLESTCWISLSRLISLCARKSCYTCPVWRSAETLLFFWILEGFAQFRSYWLLITTCDSLPGTWNIWPRSTWRSTMLGIGFGWLRQTRIGTSMSCDISTLQIMKQKKRTRLRWGTFHLVFSTLNFVEASFCKLAKHLLNLCIIVHPLDSWACISFFLD